MLTPEAVVLAEARRAYTTLSLFGYRVDGVVANRVFPAEGADDWRAGWVLAQDEVLAEVEESFAGLPLWRSEYRAARAGRRRGAAPPGRDALRRRRPARARSTVEGPFEVVAGARRRPAAARAAVRHPRPGRPGPHGDELVVTVGSYRRLLTLPAGLARLRVAGRRVDDDGVLRVRFEDPAATRRDAGDDDG